MSLCKSLVDNTDLVFRFYRDLRNILNMPYGARRRKEILSHLNSVKLEHSVDSGIFGVPVNRHHCVQLHEDPDLRYLLKRGHIVRVRMRFGVKTSHTYLVCKDYDS